MPTARNSALPDPSLAAAGAPGAAPAVPLRRRGRTLAEEVVQALSEEIRQGQLKPGDKLPTESEVMASFGVSRTVVREALSRLQASGLVETRHGIGTFVLERPAETPSPFRIDPGAGLGDGDLRASHLEHFADGETR